MTSRKQKTPTTSQWPLNEFEKALSSQRVMITVNPFKPVRGMKIATRERLSDTAFPIVLEHMERRMTWALRALYGARWQSKPTLLGNTLVGCVEAVSRTGKRILPNGHVIIDIQNEDRVLFKEKKSGALKIADKQLKLKYEELELKLEQDMRAAGLEKHYRLDVDYRFHDGKNLDYLVKGQKKDCAEFIINPHVPLIEEQLARRQNRVVKRYTRSGQVSISVNGHSNNISVAGKA